MSNMNVLINQNTTINARLFLFNGLTLSQKVKDEQQYVYYSKIEYIESFKIVTIQ